MQLHVRLAGRHVASGALCSLAGWIAAGPEHEVVELGLRLPDVRLLRCNYPFHYDAPGAPPPGDSAALAGFNVLLPESLNFPAAGLNFVAMIAADDGAPRPYAIAVDGRTERTHRVVLGEKDVVAADTALVAPEPGAVGELLEARLFDRLARERHLTLRLDLINKCNLRCVMCHYSNDAFFKRPAQRIAPEQFLSFFDPIAAVTRDVMLSCGDEPLLSPHFETILRALAARDPEVRIRFCTNAMLLTEKIAAAIVAARVHTVMFSFDGVQAATLHRIRVGSDFPRIIRQILHLKRLRAEARAEGPRFVFNFVMLESNLHEAPLFVQVARRLGAYAIDFRHVVPVPAYDIEHEMLEHFKPKYNHYRERIVAAAQAASVEIYLPPPFETAARHNPAADPPANLIEFHELLRSLGEHPLTDPEPPPAKERGPAPEPHESAHCFCDRPFSEVMIREQRDVYPCPWHTEKMGVLDGRTTLEEIFFGENFRRLRRAMLDPHGAPGCRFCPIKANYLPTRSL